MSFINLGIGQLNTIFTFSFSIFIPSGPNTTPKKSISLTFYLYFSSFIYKLFSSSLFSISSTNSSYLSLVFIISSMKLPTFSVFIKSLSSLFIMARNVANKFINLKNMTVGSKDSSRIVKAAFYSSLFFILTLLYSHLKSIFVNIFLVPMFLIMSEISSGG